MCCLNITITFTEEEPNIPSKQPMLHSPGDVFIDNSSVPNMSSASAFAAAFILHSNSDISLLRLLASDFLKETDSLSSPLSSSSSSVAGSSMHLSPTLASSPLLKSFLSICPCCHLHHQIFYLLHQSSHHRLPFSPPLQNGCCTDIHPPSISIANYKYPNSPLLQPVYCTIHHLQNQICGYC